MVQAKELRLGNLVYNRHGEIHEVRENTFQLFRYPTMDGDPAKLKGIPLTPEILEKCGFEWSIYHQSFWNEFFGYKVNWWSVGQGVDILLTLEKKINIEYLHQLQNLYFALTGEELQIDL